MKKKRRTGQNANSQASAPATADNQIASAESKQIRARWEELKTVTEGFVACCEQGNFGPLKNAAARRTGSGQPPG